MAGTTLEPDQAITAGIRDLFKSMSLSSEAIPPIIMLQLLHMCYPQFAEKSEHGGYQQQVKLQFNIHPCDPTVVICYVIWPCDISVHITYLISHSLSLGYDTANKGYFSN